MNRQAFYDQVFYSTIRITSSSPTTPGESIGTGFVISAKFKEDEPAGVQLLVTNKHVITDPAGQVALQFHKLAADGQSPDLGKNIPAELNDFGSLYREHPDPEIDLAGINISITRKLDPNVYFRTFRIEDLASFSEADLFAGKEVLFVGYPENRFDAAHNLPLLRAGHIASLPTVDFNGRRQFVIDAQVFPGSSGSPVFAELEGVLRLVGVVSQTMIRHGELQTLPTGYTFGVEQVIGLGIVIKSPALRELIEIVRDEGEVQYRRDKDTA